MRACPDCGEWSKEYPEQRPNMSGTPFVPVECPHRDEEWHKRLVGLNEKKQDRKTLYDRKLGQAQDEVYPPPYRQWQKEGAEELLKEVLEIQARIDEIRAEHK